MYLYIYDIFLNNKKYINLLNQIEARLADLEIKGKICRLNLLKNMDEAVDDGIRQGVTTVVAVGDDSTFGKVVNAIANKDVALGIIPVEANSKIGEIMGVPAGENACDILSQRLIKRLDLGRINNQYFIDSASISGSGVLLNFDKYQISPVKDAHVSICNLGFLSENESIYEKKLSNPTDGWLEAVITPLKSSFFKKNKNDKQQSIFPFKKISIASKGEPATITIDQQTVFKTPVEISVAAKKLKAIVGGGRLF